MKHIVESKHWKWEQNPFPGFRCYLGGYLKIAIPSKVSPVITYRVVGYPYNENGFIKEWFLRTLYEGTNLHEAEYVASRSSNVALKHGADTKAQVQVVQALLPDNLFRVIRTRKGTVLVVPGEDRSDRALVFVGCESGYRGGVGVEEASCNVLLTGRVSFRLWAGVEVVAIFEPGQSLVFHRTGRREDEYVRYTWDGSALSKDVYPPELFEASRLAEAARSGVGEVGEVL
jgi:hypothetical protein